MIPVLYASPTLRRLPARAVFSVTGQDTQTFLDSLLSQNMPTVAHDLRYALLLTAQGRIFADLFLYRPADESTEVWIEVQKERLADVIAHLNRFKLRSVVSIEARADLAVYSDLESTKAPQDPRLTSADINKTMGLRFIAQHSNTISTDDADYNNRRIQLGLPEAPKDIVYGDTLPIEINLDYLGAIDFTKGCYVGQELTARMHNKNLAKRRLLPFSLPVPRPDILTTGAEITTEAGMVAGTLCSHDSHQQGLALLRIDTLGEALLLGGEPLSIHWPHWLPSVGSR